jgi:hypothetical protein
MLSPKQSKHPITRFLSGGLALFIMLLALASSSPDLHAYLHGQYGCKDSCEHQDDAPKAPQPDSAQGGHVCAVTFLATGSTAFMPLALLQRVDQILSQVSIEMESIWCGQAPIRLSSRGPPMSPLV